MMEQRGLFRNRRQTPPFIPIPQPDFMPPPPAMFRVDSSGSDSDTPFTPFVSDMPPPPNGLSPGLAGPMPPVDAIDGALPASTDLVVVDPAEIGMSAGLKHLYGTKEDKRGRFQWKTSMPQDLGKPAEDAESQKWAIIVRHVRAYNDPQKVLKLHSIVVQSPLLKDLLKTVLLDYPGVAVGLKRLTFYAKFEPLIHRWKDLNEAIAKLEKDQESKDNANLIKHAILLRDLIKKEFGDVIDSAADMRTQKVITYELLWTIFPPGTLVYNKQQGQDRIFRLHTSVYGLDRQQNPVYWLTLVYIDWDGTKWGWGKIRASIPEFEGARTISTLLTYPKEFHKDASELEERLTTRGKKVASLIGSNYRAYNGLAWRMSLDQQKEIFTVRGRIIVDTYGWNRFNPQSAVFVTSRSTKDLPPNGNAPAPNLNTFGDPFNEGDEGYDQDMGFVPDGGFLVDEQQGAENEPEPLTTQQLMLCSPLVRGYALKEKIWLNFYVDAVSDVEFSSNAFESLVLPEDQKELILGFTATQQSYRTYFDDVIQGKGRGIVILLCGPPGVGKTLTAESVAEEMKVPLYAMSAGELGLDSRFVESRLQDILNMCTRWNAILLLDEADVFLEQRSLHELERNKLVSVFLRVLEYYEGIMFLTTNRVQTFDPAFQSRIHISLDYPDLDTRSRKKIWSQFLALHNVAQATARATPPKPLSSAAKVSSVRPILTPDAEREREQQHLKQTMAHEMTLKDIQRLSELPMNGRQIKNILKTAQLLASKRGEGLKFEHVESVMRMTQHLHNVHQESERNRSSLFS